MTRLILLCSSHIQVWVQACFQVFKRANKNWNETFTSQTAVSLWAGPISTSGAGMQPFRFFVVFFNYFPCSLSPSSQSYGFSSSHVWLWELDYKESWAPKHWCFWTLVLEKTLESPLDSKKIQLVHPKGNQSWIFIGRTDAEAETPILWPFDEKNWLIWKKSRCWERLKVEREGDIRGWDGWMASLTQWAWVWASSGSWW